MEEILNNLKVDLTNGEESFCYSGNYGRRITISEKQLEALKELVKRHDKELDRAKRDVERLYKKKSKKISQKILKIKGEKLCLK